MSTQEFESKASFYAARLGLGKLLAGDDAEWAATQTQLIAQYEAENPGEPETEGGDLFEAYGGQVRRVPEVPQPSPRTAAAPPPNPRAAAATAAEARELECLQAEIDALEEELAEPTARLDGFAFELK
eukprot:SAG22_NODE_1889_length_3373_cov_2.935247_1_plen_128_part_00